MGGWEDTHTKHINQRQTIAASSWIGGYGLGLLLLSLLLFLCVVVGGFLLLASWLFTPPRCCIYMQNACCCWTDSFFYSSFWFEAFGPFFFPFLFFVALPSSFLSTVFSTPWGGGHVRTRKRICKIDPHTHAARRLETKTNTCVACLYPSSSFYSYSLSLSPSLVLLWRQH